MTISDYTSRNLNSIADAERKLRANAEEIARRYRKLLIELATRLAGEALQQVQRENPHALENWQPRDWEQFWYANMPVPSHGWGSSTSAAPSAKRAAEDQETERLKHEAAGLLNSLNDVRRRMGELEHENKALNEQLHQQDRMLGQRTKAAVKKDAKPVSNVYGSYVEQLSKLTMPDSIPERFLKRIGPGQGATDLRYKRQMQVMWLVAEAGISSRLEIDRLVGLCEGVQMGSGSIRKAAQEMEQSGLITAKTLEMTTPINTRLIVYRLSVDGAEFWRSIGRTAVPSDWQKMLAGYQGEQPEQHALAVLAFSMHARMRGWEAQILPAVDGPALPDVRVTRGDETFLVAIERGNGSADKWKNLAQAAGGKVAICALDETNRAELKKGVTALGLKGVATDLRSLIFLNGNPRQVDEVQSGEPLWLESW